MEISEMSGIFFVEDLWKDFVEDFLMSLLSLSNANYNGDFLREPWLLETRSVLGNQKKIACGGPKNI